MSTYSNVENWITKHIAVFVAVGVLGLAGLELEAHNVQEQLNVTTKESAVARISTVEQRCKLTQELVVVFKEKAVGVSTPTDIAKRVAPFEASTAKCFKQLVQVKVLAAATP